jgi:hypothetical protein
VFRRLCILLTLICPLAKAQIRWCTITGKSETDKLIYTPIARAAHIEGVVIQRINFTSAGKVLSLEPVSGHAVLANAAAQQLSTWHLQTDAAGDQDCQSIVVIKYRLEVNDPPSIKKNSPTPGMLQISIDATPIVLSDPSGTITGRRRFHFF